MAQRPKDADEIEERIEAALLSLDVGLLGSERRRDVVEALNWAVVQKKKLDHRKEQRRTFYIGILSMITTFVITTALSWATGALQWLVNLAPPKR